MKRKFDIIVIGGGLAGASFAKVVAERGLQVLVLERENENWENAGRTYAGEHNRAYATIHATEDLFSTFFLETGPAADARRSRAFPLIAEEPDRVPDAFMSGPDAAPINEHSRNRFFGEV